MSPRILVVYFSRSGNTQKVAERIASALGAELEAIVDHTQRSGLVGYLRSGFEALFGRRVEIEPAEHDPTTYDLVVVGAPIWNMSVASPVRSYLERHGHAMRAVGFFCTCGGAGGERALAQMAHASGKQPVATLIVREGELARADLVEMFASDLRRAIPMGATLPIEAARPEAEGRRPEKS